MCAGVGLARKAHNRAVFASNLSPVVDFAAIDVGDLLQAQAIDGVARINDNSDGVAGDDELDWLTAVFLDSLDLFGFDLAGSVGDIYGVVDHSSNPRAGAAASDRDTHLGMQNLVSLGPSQRQIDDRVGAFVLNVHSRLGISSDFLSCSVATTIQEGR